MTDSTQTIRVEAERPYDVRIGSGVLTTITELVPHGGMTAIIHPPALEQTARQVADLVPGAVLIEVPAGEEAKTLQVVENCCRRLATAGFTRSDTVVGLGGGSTTDLAGFVAATWLRGVRYVSIPTTVLGMADAGVGGKTGVNLPEGKNLVGAFWEPVGVVCDLDLLSTLPVDEVRSGLAEVIKCGLIADSTILAIASAAGSALLDTSSTQFAHCLQAAIAVKARVVSADLRECADGGGLTREALNLGHTLAHGIERLQGYTWRHGDAVAVGMVFAAEVAHRLGMLTDDEVETHRRLLSALDLPVSYQGSAWGTMRAVMSVDKKARGSLLRLVLLEGIGHPVVKGGIGEDILADAYRAVGGHVEGFG